MSESALHPEDRARSWIDRQLFACGWLIQSKADINLGAGLGVAVREFPTASGPVDYGLFVGRKLCGVIEAKPEGATLSGFSEQAARYIADLPKRQIRDEGQVRFEYVASGAETLFRDHADPDPVSRRVFAFHRPETLERWLKETATLRARLQSMPPIVNEGLRACQTDAVAALERSMLRITRALWFRWRRARARLSRPARSAIVFWRMPVSGASCSWLTAPISFARRGMNISPIGHPARGGRSRSYTTSRSSGRGPRQGCAGRRRNDPARLFRVDRQGTGRRRRGVLLVRGRER